MAKPFGDAGWMQPFEILGREPRHAWSLSLHEVLEGVLHLPVGIHAEYRFPRVTHRHVWRCREAAQYLLGPMVPAAIDGRQRVVSAPRGVEQTRCRGDGEKEIGCQRKR